MKKRLLVVLLAICLVCCTKEAAQLDLSKANSIADLKGAKIAIQGGTLHADIAVQIEDGKLTEYPSIDDMAIAVKSGVVDGAFMDGPIAITYCGKDDSFGYVPLVNNKTGFTCDATLSGNACAVNEGSELREKINAVLAELDPNAPYKLMEQIIDLSLGKEVTEFAITGKDVENPVGTLKVGMECCSEPFNWTDENGASFGAVPIASEGYEGLYANGLDVQIARYVAEKLNMKLEVYAIEWDSLIPSVQSGVIDVIIGNMSPTRERDENGVDFTTSYYDVNYVILYKKK